jgi:hypothetical protein
MVIDWIDWLVSPYPIPIYGAIAPCIFHASPDNTWIDRPWEPFYDTLSFEDLSNWPSPGRLPRMSGPHLYERTEQLDKQ